MTTAWPSVRAWQRLMIVGRRHGFRWHQRRRDSRYQVMNVDGTKEGL